MFKIRRKFEKRTSETDNRVEKRCILINLKQLCLKKKHHNKIRSLHTQRKPSNSRPFLCSDKFFSCCMESSTQLINKTVEVYIIAESKVTLRFRDDVVFI